MTEKRFKEVRDGGTFAKSGVIVDQVTGVNYLWHHEGNAGGLTVLVDAKGNPIVTKPSYVFKDKLDKN